jgi:hypothetical protein
VGFGEVKGDKVVTYSIIRLIEVVIDVPTNFSKLLSLLDHSVEEGEHVKHRFEFLFGTTFENVICKFGVRVLDILTKTIWGLSHNLQCLLQDTKRELVGRVSCQPQSKSWVWLLDRI